MKRFFTVFGAISSLLVVSLLTGITVLASKAAVSSEQNKAAAVAAIQQISDGWTVSGRERIAAPGLIRIAQTGRGNRAFRTFSRLGKLVQATEIAQTKFGVSTETGTTATIIFRGKFENGSAKVIVRLRRIDGVMKVLGLQTKETVLEKRATKEVAWSSRLQTNGRS